MAGLFFEILIIIFGLLAIVILANIIIKRNISLCESINLSGTFIGMTILSIGTSLPEIITHNVGSLHILNDSSLYNTSSALVVGTNIGSDIFQQNFILGVIAILSIVTLRKKQIFPLFSGLIGSAILLFLLSFDGFIYRWEGTVLILSYLFYLFYLYHNSKQEKKPKAKFTSIKSKKLFKKQLASDFFVIIICFVFLAIVANKVLTASEAIVSSFSISASFFGIIIIGFAVALPEFTTALLALKHKQKGMSVGVLIGSNITNPTLALGLGALISSYFVPKAIILYDLPIKILSA